MLRAGIVGTGAIAGVYAQALRLSQRACLAAVCDTNLDAARRFAATAGVQAYPSAAAMASAERLDAAIVCTPPDTHAPLSIDLLRRGIAVLCEKPLSIDRDSAVRMLDAARESGAVLTMGSKFRYAADVIEAKRMVETGTIGEIVLFENAFTSYVDMRSRWNAQPERSGGGVIIDNGTHSVDLVRYFLGPVACVHAIEGKRSQGLRVEETVHVFVKNPEGVMGNIDLSWSIQKTTESYLDIYGTGGTITVGWKQSRFRRAGEADWTAFGTGYDKLQAFRSQIDNFAGAVAGTEALRIGPADALASVDVVEALYRSLRNDNWVDVANHERRRRSRKASKIA